MANSILLVGVGGQGTILISKILTAGLTQLGYQVKMSEIHGMSQRGGSVSTQIKYGESVYAPNIGLAEADMVISLKKTAASTLSKMQILPTYMEVFEMRDIFCSKQISLIKKTVSRFTTLRVSPLRLNVLTKQHFLLRKNWKTRDM